MFEKLLRNYIVMDIYTNSLMPESTLENIVVMFQWIAMEYTIIRHTLFLKWLLEEQKSLTYSDVRDYIVVISRMMGYDHEDIYEYLEKSFEAFVWDWGYLALLTGKN